MSYEKQTWANGDVITATGLNHMEDGISGALELPAVTADDKDKYLHTNYSTGALEWAEAGGSDNGVFVVHANVTSGEGDDYTVSVTESMADIRAAVQAEKEVIMYAIYDNDTDNIDIFRLSNYVIGDVDIATFYTSPTVSGDSIEQGTIAKSDEGWLYTFNTYPGE